MYTVWVVIGMSLKLFHLDAENLTRKFRTSLPVSDTVVITGCGWCAWTGNRVEVLEQIPQ